MSIRFIWQLMQKNSVTGVLSVDSGRTDVYLYTGDGLAVTPGIDTPYGQLLDSSDDGVYTLEVSKTNIYSVVVGGSIVTGDEGIKIDADPPRTINLDSGETVVFDWGSGVTAEIGRGTTDADKVYIKLMNANGDDSYIYPNSTNNGLNNDGTTKP